MDTDTERRRNERKGACINFIPMLDIRHVMQRHFYISVLRVILPRHVLMAFSDTWFRPHFGTC